MPGNPREVITAAERRFPVRIRLAVPPDGFGQRLEVTEEWLDGNCGADGWSMTPSGTRGCSTMRSRLFPRRHDRGSLVARWCPGSKVETVNGAYSIRADDPPPRIPSPLHRTP